MPRREFLNGMRVGYIKCISHIGLYAVPLVALWNVIIPLQPCAICRDDLTITQLTSPARRIDNETLSKIDNTNRVGIGNGDPKSETTTSHKALSLLLSSHPSTHFFYTT